MPDTQQISTRKEWFEKLDESNDFIPLCENVNKFVDKIPLEAPPVETLAKQKCITQLGNWRQMCLRTRRKLFYLENQLDSFLEDYTRSLVAEFHYGKNGNLKLTNQALLPIALLE
jgi:hypothetical protein